MPTMLPDRAARARHQRRHLSAKLTAIVAAIFYLLLLAWNVSSLQANFRSSFGPSERHGEYNPMERGPLIAADRTRVTGPTLAGR